MAKKLGKGLGAIISTPETSDIVSKTPNVDATTAKAVTRSHANSVVDISLDQIAANPDQPREHFSESEIENLAESIKSVGLIQPILLRKAEGTYHIIAGERRFRATQLLGKRTIKAIVIKATEEQNVTLALIENIQRQDLDPIEEARAYKVLVTRFNLKQAEVAKKVGKERATVANAIRLLSLPDNIIKAVSSGAISQGHAKILAGVSGSKKEFYFKKILAENLSVRGLEALIKSEFNEEAEPSKVLEKPKKDPHLKKMEDKLVSTLGTKVEIKHSATGKGKIEINYYSLDDFDRIVERFE